MPTKPNLISRPRISVHHSKETLKVWFDCSHIEGIPFDQEIFVTIQKLHGGEWIKIGTTVLDPDRKELGEAASTLKTRPHKPILPVIQDDSMESLYSTPEGFQTLKASTSTVDKQFVGNEKPKISHQIIVKYSFSQNAKIRILVSTCDKIKTKDNLLPDTVSSSRIPLNGDNPHTPSSPVHSLLHTLELTHHDSALTPLVLKGELRGSNLLKAATSQPPSPLRIDLVSSKAGENNLGATPVVNLFRPVIPGEAGSTNLGNTDGGYLLLHCSKWQENPRQLYHISLAAKEITNFEFMGTSDPYFMIFKPSLEWMGTENPRIIPDKEWSLVYRSETVWSNLKPTFCTLIVDSNWLCYENINANLKIEVWDDDKKGPQHHVHIGTAYVTPDKMETMQDFAQRIAGNKSKGLPQEVHFHAESHHSVRTGTMLFKEFRGENVEGLVDLFSKGLKLNLSVVIDFTASNGDPTSVLSFHCRTKGGANPYQTIIKEVGKAIFEYQAEGQFIKVYGFGAKLPNKYETSHFFPLMDKKGRTLGAKNLDGVLALYDHAFSYLELAGPTKFEQLTLESTERASQLVVTSPMDYSVVLVLTDGCVCDLEETKKAIKEAGKTGLSFLIVGVGDDEFTDMNILDNDHGEMGYDCRDCVQFVDTKKCKSTGQLQDQLLSELANQIVEYFSTTRNNITKEA